MSAPRLGMVFPRELPAHAVTEFARRLDDGGGDELWVIEDCFYTAGVSLAAAALAVTERLHVGIGIMPAPLRNPALAAMEIATLSGLAPGRITAGIGHGVQEWMAQAGVRPASPITTLREVIHAVRQLLRGETVTVTGQHVHLTDVQLVAPPDPVPAVLAGVRQPRSLAAAGEVADGVLLAEVTGPSAVRAAWARTGHSPDDPDFEIAVFASLIVARDRADARAIAAPLIAEWAAQRVPALHDLPFAAQLFAWADARNVGAIAGMPDDWWGELGPIGTMDDAAAFIDGVHAAGARRVNLFPAPELDLARAQIADVAALYRTMSADT